MLVKYAGYSFCRKYENNLFFIYTKLVFSCLLYLKRDGYTCISSSELDKEQPVFKQKEAVFSG